MRAMMKTRPAVKAAVLVMCSLLGRAASGAGACFDTVWSHGALEEAKDLSGGQSSQRRTLSPATQVKVLVPTSDAVDISRIVARNQGYNVSNRTLSYFDVLRTKDGKPPIPGYITVGFYVNSSPVLDISINETTGQVVDATRCLLFEYADVEKYSRDIRRMSKARPLTHDELKSALGCTSLEVRRTSVGRKR